eukprot:3854884-Pyramimonas_sp.AAC.1
MVGSPARGGQHARLAPRAAVGTPGLQWSGSAQVGAPRRCRAHGDLDRRLLVPGASSHESDEDVHGAPLPLCQAIRGRANDAPNALD